MDAELQTTAAAEIDWQSVGPAEIPAQPSPSMRLLARIPHVGDRPRPSGQVLPDERLHGEQARGRAETNSPVVDSQDRGIHSLAASRDAPFGAPAGTDLVTQLFEFHTVIKPYAGVIVTLALLASAGLLYWLVTGPVLNPSDPQQQIGQDMLGQHSRDSDTSYSVAPVWSASESRSDVTEDSNRELNASPRGPVPDSAEVIAGSATPEATPTSALAPTAGVASMGIPCVKYAPTVSVPTTGPPAVVEKVSGDGLQATETRLAETPSTPSSTGTTHASPDLAAVTHADTLAPTSTVSQPSTSPSIQSYPKTRYGPFDFARIDSSGNDGNRSPMVARRPEMNRPGQLPR